MGNLNHKENEKIEASYDSNVQTCTLSFAVVFVNVQMGKNWPGQEGRLLSACILCLWAKPVDIIEFGYQNTGLQNDLAN